MDNIENYYKNIEKPIINDFLYKYNLKNLLELTTITYLYVFYKKRKNEWKLKEKSLLLKECEHKRKIKIEEINNQIKYLAKNKSKNIIVDIKNKNNNILSDIENIDILIETIEKEYPIIENNFLEIFSN